MSYRPIDQAWTDYLVAAERVEAAARHYDEAGDCHSVKELWALDDAKFDQLDRAEHLLELLRDGAPRPAAWLLPWLMWWPRRAWKGLRPLVWGSTRTTR